MHGIAFTLGLCLAAVGATAASDPTPAIRGRFQLLDARNGAKVSETSFNGKWRLVFFGFTHCPLTCPLGLNTLDSVLRQLGKDADRVQALFISLDPERDTPQAMAAFLKNFDPRIIGLTGSRQAVDVAMREFRLEAERLGKDGNYVFEHPAIIYLMGPHNEYLAVLPSNGDPAELAAQIKQTLSPKVAP
jgi:protein SCO1/2